MRKIETGLAIVSIVLMPAGALAKDYEAGKKKATEICAACHGEDGNKPITPETPRLAGQHYDYLVHSLEMYKSGKRQNPLMSPMAKPLTKEEIDNVAYYFSRQTGLETKY
ncbi:MAG TPA: cytochrome c [Burkholderiales bacterium]|nr:cytochrome c [Burkholderiales bacterium]